jgi:hypothetical protein
MSFEREEREKIIRRSLSSDLIHSSCNTCEVQYGYMEARRAVRYYMGRTSSAIEPRANHACNARIINRGIISREGLSSHLYMGIRRLVPTPSLERRTELLASPICANVSSDSS